MLTDAQPRPRDQYWVEYHGRAMGSTVDIVAGDVPPGAFSWAAEELERLEECWSRFRPTSELSRCTTSAGWWDASPTLLLALTCAADLHRATQGRFDPTILDALEAAGYDRTFDLVRADTGTPARAACPAPGYARVEVDEPNARVRIPAGCRVDLGGIGKGLAADLIARGLVDRGARHVLVSLGGDLRARGDAPPGGSWRIPVEHPGRAPAVAFEYALTDGAIVTSTTHIRSWTRAGVRHHHIIDPARGASTASGVIGVVAAARDAWWAEGIAKAAVIAGAEAGVALARANLVRVWIFDEHGGFVDSKATA